MRNLNETIRRRALQWIESADKSEREETGGSVTWQVIADRMAEYTGEKRDTVRRQLDRYLHPDKHKGSNHVWRADYIQAFSRAFGRDPSLLVTFEANPQVKEATKAQVLLSAVADRLDIKQTRDLARLVNQLLDDKPRAALMAEFARVVLDAESKEAALMAVSAALHGTHAFDAKRRDLRRKRSTGQKV